MEINALTIGLAVFATTYLFLRALLSFTQDASEPHALATSIPFISPLIKMAKQSEFYIETWCAIDNLLIILLHIQPGTTLGFWM